MELRIQIVSIVVSAASSRLRAAAPTAPDGALRDALAFSAVVLLGLAVWKRRRWRWWPAPSASTTRRRRFRHRLRLLCCCFCTSRSSSAARRPEQGTRAAHACCSTIEDQEGREALSTGGHAGAEDAVGEDPAPSSATSAPAPWKRVSSARARNREPPGPRGQLRRKRGDRKGLTLWRVNERSAVRHIHPAGAAAPTHSTPRSPRPRLRALHPRPEVPAFEPRVRRGCGARHAIGVANGTEALTIALKAMGVGPGDEVVVPSSRSTPRRGDPADRRAPGVLRRRPRDGLRHRRHVARADAGTKAVIACTPSATSPRSRRSRRWACPALEDAAQAAGTTRTPAVRAPGTAATSASSPRRLGCFGDGGGDHPTRRDGPALRTLRFHGSHDNIDLRARRLNSRLDELQAAILRVQLPHLTVGRRPPRGGGATTPTPGSAS